MYEDLVIKINEGDIPSIARSITLLDSNNDSKYDLLRALRPNPDTISIGITGPPGAGKSTLTSALIASILDDKPESKIAVLAIDPSSPFNKGALLGDRIRMNEHYLDPRIYIRSLASKGSLGGLNPNTLEVLHLLQSADFDYIIIETVGVGQSEVEIAGLADTTLLVLVPESGDEIQMMKSGVLEVADVIAINKADRPGAEQMAAQITKVLHTKPQEKIPVLLVEADKGKGIDLLKDELLNPENTQNLESKAQLRTLHLLKIIQKNRMKDLQEKDLYDRIYKEMQGGQSPNIFQIGEEFS